MPEAKKRTRGYRVRLTVFVPADSSDISKTRAAIDFAEKLNTLPDGAPTGTVIEHFSARPGEVKDGE